MTVFLARRHCLGMHTSYVLLAIFRKSFDKERRISLREEGQGSQQETINLFEYIPAFAKALEMLLLQKALGCLNQDGIFLHVSKGDPCVKNISGAV